MLFRKTDKAFQETDVAAGDRGSLSPATAPRFSLLPQYGGDARTCGGGLRRSTVAHFARKVRGTNIVAAKHELKIQQSNAPERWPCSLRVRGPHFASKVSYNAGAATDDYSGPTHIFDARALLPNYNSFYERPISHDGEYHSPSSSESSVSVFLPFICSSSSGVYSSS